MTQLDDSLIELGYDPAEIARKFQQLAETELAKKKAEDQIIKLLDWLDLMTNKPNTGAR